MNSYQTSHIKGCGHLLLGGLLAFSAQAAIMTALMMMAWIFVHSDRDNRMVDRQDFDR
jgi:hypothetical protein